MVRKNGEKPEDIKKGSKDEVNEETIVDLNIDEAVIEEAIPEETPLMKATKEAEELKNSLMRMQADFENFKKRNKEISGKMYNSGVMDAVITIFPVIDSLDLAMNIYTKEKDKSGIELVLKQFMTAMESLGVKEIEALGKEFTPEYHEAVMKVDANNGEDSGVIVEVFRKGYIFSEKVLRPSMVKITN